jgi:hypothetical protein
MASKMQKLGLVMLAPAQSYKCPGSGSFIHASCEVTAVAAASCADVAAEMKARASAQGGWVDPHNGGIYSVTSSSDTELQTQRSTNPQTSVGGKVYTDKQIFTLTPQGSSCQIEGCSESQGTSVGDFSTNYCDMRNLYCGSADGCKPVTKDFTSTESSVSPSIGAGHDFSQCIVKSEVSALASRCPDKLHAVYADMHDGDKKEITVSGESLTIKPSGNDQTWVVHTKINPSTCKAVVDFNVPGKPNPPPVSLEASLLIGTSIEGPKSKTEFGFTDPSGTLPKGPLNRWVELGSSPTQGKIFCPKFLKAVYADMHDGDQKEIVISGTSLKITPSGNSQNWEVKSELDPKTCSAIIDFNVPGKPNPPPVTLKATAWVLGFPSINVETTEFEFTDPSGTLADAEFPLNRWVPVNGGDIVV